MQAKAAAAALAALMVIAAAPATAASARMTHKLTIAGELVNNWTVSEDRDCGPVGDGVLTVKFRTTKPTRVFPYLDNYKGGKWNVGVPLGNNLTAMSPAKATGTADRVDNTTPRPSPYPDEPCAPLDKSGCGTSPLLRTTKAAVFGLDARRIYVRVYNNPFERGRECLVGDASLWSGPQALMGGNRDGLVVVKMPKPSAFKRRRVVRLTARTQKRSAYGDPGSGSSTNDITRKVTITFKRL